MSSPARERVVVVSHRHLATPEDSVPDRLDEDAAFAGRLDALAGRPPTHLVLLGDALDLLHAVGVSVGMDAIDLLPPHPPRRFRELLAGAPGDAGVASRIACPAWVVHSPGVLHHFQTTLTLEAGEGNWRRPAARPPGLRLRKAKLELAARRRERSPGAAAGALQATGRAARVARAGPRLTLGAGPRARRQHAHGLRDHGLELGLPRDVSLETDRRATLAPLATVGRLRARGTDSGHTPVADDRLRFIEIEHGDGYAPTAPLGRCHG